MEAGSAADAATLWFTAGTWFGIEILLQVAWTTATRYRPLGDEHEYVERAAASDPFRSGPFFRVPVMAALAWVAGRVGHPATVLRILSVASSAVTLACTAATIRRLADPTTTMLLMAVLALFPERLAYGSRIWPDVHLAACTSAITLLLLGAAGAEFSISAAATVAITAGLASLIRLDALIVAPAAAAGWFVTSARWDLAESLLIVVGSFVVFTIWWLTARLILGRPWPDDTWRFNVELARAERAVSSERRPYAVDELVEVVRHRGIGSRSEIAPSAALPGLRPLLSRLHTLLGPDTFVRGKILPSLGFDRAPAPMALLDSVLRFGFPLLAATLVGVAIANGSALMAVALAGTAPLIGAAAFHARTRFRLPAIPAAMVAIAVGLAPTAAAPSASRIAIAAVFAIIVLLASSRQPVRSEIP
jgi:hypothetical protein